MTTIITLTKPCVRCNGSLYIDQDENEYYLKCRSCSRKVKIDDFSDNSEYGRTKLNDLFNELKLSAWFAGVKKHRVRSSTPFIGNPVDKAISSTINLSNYIEVIYGVLEKLLSEESDEDKTNLIEYLTDLKKIERLLPSFFIRLKEGEKLIPDFDFRIMSELANVEIQKN